MEMTIFWIAVAAVVAFIAYKWNQKSTGKAPGGGRRDGEDNE